MTEDEKKALTKKINQIDEILEGLNYAQVSRIFIYQIARISYMFLTKDNTLSEDQILDDIRYFIKEYFADFKHLNTVQ